MGTVRREREGIDFGDEEAVLAEMAAELDVDVDELKIKESHLGSFGVGTVYEITIRGGGHKEWMVVENSDQEEELAVEIVKQDLEEEPELFEKSFIESHINMDRLRRDLTDDVLNNNIETLQDRSDDEFWREYERGGFDAPEEDEDGNRPEPNELQIEELAEQQTKEQLQDPMQYMDDVYGADAAKEAIRIAGIDVDAAAEEAVDTDGTGHFLSGYDGETHETKSGLVYWRAN